jgi:hypothetical protein
MSQLRNRTTVCTEMLLVQPQTRRRRPQGDVELMTEKQILGFELVSRLEHGGDEHSERMQDHQTSIRIM